MVKYLPYIAGVFLLTLAQLLGQANYIPFHQVEDGLSQNTVSSIVQDEYGFLWIGTRYGLNRYDGRTFQQYEHNEENPNSLSNNFINCLLADQEGKIWIGTYGGGLNVYDLNQNTFQHFDKGAKAQEALSDDYVTALYQDKNGIIWIGTEKGGLNIYDPQTKAIDQSFAYDKKKAKDVFQYISAIAEDKEGNIWLGTWNNGLQVIEKQTGNIQKIEAAEKESIRCLHFSQSQRLWVGCNQGIKEVIPILGGFKLKDIQVSDIGLFQQLNESVVLSIYEDPNGLLWVGTENNGLFSINLQNGFISLYKKNVLDNNSLSSNSIWSLFSDKEGTLWIGTYLKGLNKVDPLEQKFEKNSQINLGNRAHALELVSAFAEDQQGNVWIGTDGGGLIYKDQTNDAYRHYHTKSKWSLSSDGITSLLLDQNQNLWIGTWNGGINLWNTQDSTFQKINVPQLSGTDVHSIMEDQKGCIWIATFRAGLDVYNPTTQTYTHFNTQNEPKRRIESVKIRTLTQDLEGNIWIGTEGGGLQRIKVNDDLEIIESKSFFTQKQGSEAYSINTLFTDSRGKVWIGTEGNGLCIYDRKVGAFAQLTQKDGLPSDMIYAILEDDKGLIWASTNRGIFSFNQADKSIISYTTADGLQASEFYKSACLKSQEGRLYFGGINGFNQFFPDKINKNNRTPNLYITNVLISNQRHQNGDVQKSKTIFNDQDLALKYFENDLSFEFTALNFTQSSKNQYQYKLENYDEQWRKVGGENIAYYPNVPPGNYKFWVKAANNDGIWNEQGAWVNVHIAKPWYATYFAYFIYFLLTGGLLWWARNNIISKERLKGQLHLEQMEVGKMQELDELRSQFFANISHEFKTPLTLIISPLQMLKKNTKGATKTYDVMLKNAERLYRLINQILDLSKIESGNARLNANNQDIVNFLKYIAINFTNYAQESFINYKIELPRHDIPLYFDKQKMEKVFVNLISNAFKYTPSYGNITITLKESKDEVEILVKDSGQGISLEEKDLIFDRYYKTQNNTSFASTGIGLSLTKQLIELHQGSIEVDSELNKGTTFIVRLKKGKDHLKEGEIVDKRSDFTYSEESLIRMKEFGGKQQEAVLINETINDDRPLILIAEDNEDLRGFIFDSLSKNYKVFTAENGVEAYKLAMEQVPDVVISDVMMPEMDGFELSQKLKNNQLTSHIFIIMLTVKTAEGSYEQGFLSGVDSYLTKPFNMHLLEMRIQNLLQSRKNFKDQLNSNNLLQLNPKKLPTDSLDEKFIKDFIAVIEQNMSNPSFNIDNVCKEMGFSRSQFYRKTKSLLGQTPNEFIKGIKLKRAAQLLQDSDYKISEITYKVGFNDLKYFRECFKKQYSMNPSEYAKKAKAGNLSES